MNDVLPRPHASTHRVEDLVKLVVSGRVRIPNFQRPFNWEANDVIELLQSIHLGYPIGSLLFYRKSAPAQVLHMGPITIHAPETDAALWVVDGQQRIVSLVISLRRPAPIPTTPEDPWVVYFDSLEDKFHSPHVNGEIPATWVPLTAMLEPSTLSEWISQWPHSRDSELRQAVFRAATRLREYTIPSYTVDTDDPQVLKSVFLRINKLGKQREWREIHDALYGDAGPTDAPSTLGELADALVSVGMGRPDDDQLLRCWIAFAGPDVTQNLAAALPTLRRVLAFLRADAQIPHLRLLPWSAPLPILTRFFRLHPAPNARSRELLTRWLWRSILSAHLHDVQIFERSGVGAIDAHDEEGSVQELLTCLPKQAPPRFQLPERFDACSHASRLVLLGLNSLEPRDLDTGHPLDVGATIEEYSTEAFRQIVDIEPMLATRPANRIILPGRGLARAEILAVAQRASILRSHAISATALEALGTGEHEIFLIERAKLLEEHCNQHAMAMADWAGNDRPSLDYILEHDVSAVHD